MALMCTTCGAITDGKTRTMDGLLMCSKCFAARSMLRELAEDVLGQAAANAEIAAEEAEQRVPVNIIATSRSIDRSERSLLVDRIGQIEHDAWEAGFEAAVRIVEHEGGTAVAQTLREALADYWETQGVERDE